MATISKSNATNSGDPSNRFTTSSFLKRCTNDLLSDVVAKQFVDNHECRDGEVTWSVKRITIAR